MHRRARWARTARRGPARFGTLVPLVAALVALMAQSALAADATVSVVDGSFQPNLTAVRLGGTVEWDFASTNGFNHTTTDTTGLAIWDSGSEAPGAVFSFAFAVSGTFPYHCTFHLEMVGKVRVPVRASPASGTQTTTFGIRWATATPSGDKYNVQVTGPQDGGVWKPFKTGTTTLAASFVPNQGVGTYRFRAQLTNGTLSSGFSPPKAISVTS